MACGNKTISRSSTVLEYRYRINAAMRYIHENPGELLDIKSVAEEVRFSPFHFHRIFADYVGETVADYIRKVRMRKAVELLSAGIRIIDIASETGYQTTSAFSKAFRQTVGVKPSAFRNHDTTKIIHSFELTHRRNTTNLNLIPKIVLEPERDLYFISRKVPEAGLLNENIGLAFHDAFEKWFYIIDQHKLQPYLFKRLGIIRGFDSFSPEKHSYDAGVIFSRPVNVYAFEEVKQAKIRAGKWAVFLHTGPYNTLWQTWSWIYNYWRWNGNFKIREEDPYEVYLNNKRFTPAEDLLTNIYIPVY